MEKRHSGSSVLRPRRNSRRAGRIYENKLGERTSEFVRVPTKIFVDTAIEKARLCIQDYPCTYRNLDNGGLFTGSAGLGVMCFLLSRAPGFEQHRQEMLSSAKEIVDKTVEYCTRSVEKSDVVSFFFGKGGMFAVSAAVYRTVGKEQKATEYMMRYVQGQALCRDVNYSLTGGDDVSNGRCGYILGLIWLSQFFTNNELRLYSLYNLLNATYVSGKNQAEKEAGDGTKKFDTPLLFPYVNIKYLGALNGLCGILHVFLVCSFFLNENKHIEEDVHKAVDFLLSLQRPDGSFPDKLEDVKIGSESYESCAQWYTGACGMVLLMARAYRRWNDNKYLKSCILSTGFVWNKGLTRASIGLISGVAGNCYAFLIMYRLLNEPTYLYKAIQFASFMLSEKCLRCIFDKRIGKNPYNISDGLAGAIILLSDLVNPMKADFPFFPVFTSIERLR